jgi:3-methyladenine DNA glycosylase/8-oxoguanine DNA glycosylase
VTLDEGRAPTNPASLRPLRHGRADPTIRFAADGVWRATHTPEGPGTIHLRVDGGQPEAWGPGGDWLLARVPAMNGALDSLDGFDPSRHPLVEQLARRASTLRITRTERVLDALVPAILEQKVTGKEARRAWVGLVHLLDDPAPGPVPLLLTPSAARLLEVPSHAFHRLGVERRRAETIHRCARVAHRLEEAVELGTDVLDARLRSIAGIGVWTSAEVRSVALGDADAVSVGDYHLPHTVAYALAGEVRGNDDRMLELLAPFAGHRGRVARLIEGAGITAPRRGPRMRLRQIAWH